MPEVSSFSREDFETYRVGDFGRPLHALAVTGSTNLDALDRAELGDPEGTVVVADHQRAGRGRWGREWIGKPGGSLMFSLVLRPEGSPALITTALGVAVAQAIEALTELSCGIKWPNDVLIEGRKVAGILVESRGGAGEPHALVAGVGVNLDLDPAELPEELRGTATSIGAALTARGERFTPSREQLLAGILTAFEARYPVDAPEVLSEAAARSTVLGNEVTIRLPDDRMLTGTATRLLDDGSLELSTDDGTVALASGEVAALRPG